MIFLCMCHSCFGFLWVLIYDWGSWTCYTHLQAWNSPPRGLFFLPHATDKSLLVSPRFWFAVSSFSFLGCCGFLLSHFGHDRAKNDLGIKFPRESCVLPKLSPRFVLWCLIFFPRAVNCLFCCVYAVVGLWTVLEWE